MNPLDKLGKADFWVKRSLKRAQTLCKNNEFLRVLPIVLTINKPP